MEQLNQDRDKKFMESIIQELKDNEPYYQIFETQETYVKLSLSRIILDQLLNEIVEILEHVHYSRKEPDEYVSPLKLCRKTFGNIPKWNKKPNEVLCDFQKSIIDNKSCNDDDSQDDLFLSYTETERTTPNPEDLLNLLNCRKKMSLFKNCINDRTIKEYENILNSENIFINKKFLNNHQTKKSNFWHKHIRQILRDNNNSKTHNSFLSRISAGSIVKNIDKNNNKEDELFILGILESAVNERKGRYTTNM